MKDTQKANQSVSRALQIMEILAESDGPLGVREVARQIRVSPAIAQRLVSALTESGFAEQEALSRRYRVGLRAFTVGSAFLSGDALVREAQPELRELSDKHGLNSYLAVRRGRSVVYLVTCQSSGPITIKTAPGALSYLHSTSLGKALLCNLPDAEIERLLGPEPYRRLTARTKTRLAPLLRELHAAARTGTTVCDEENLVGVFAIGAPVRDASGQTIAAISGALPRHDVSVSRVRAVSTLIRDAAERVSLRLGAPLPAAPSKRRTSRGT
jgi:DNA-binding IclR family transcriptional regulator